METTKKAALITGALTGNGYELRKFPTEAHFNPACVSGVPERLSEVSQQTGEQSGGCSTERTAAKVYQERKSKGVKIIHLVYHARSGRLDCCPETSQLQVRG